ncbi:2-oxoglutarate dehydrogenase complex dihydrolipoyllysine-residue succinyltransferase [Candidatus Laterigemmans baculatus]|uniref:2-oxoglutarate dehydrogenase complex dihydrolipoyllysine-residue succinyltransferase n=1 Tax=Candidatus Laterigemmans baculatus TaxID=2770505 RepID=UPI0013DC0C9F|nr:2-oxoglutarate dehydrogenase complex dihydrolipoyllysine-residue succinyltransferase [Candidatus Laterigemmans baculatus]
MVEVKVPQVGESISEVQIGQWLKQEGDWVAAGDDLVDIETEKASVQVPAPEAGFLRNIRVPADEFAAVGDTIAEIEPAPQPAGGSTAPPSAPAATPERAAAPEPARGAEPAPTPAPHRAAESNGAEEPIVMPAAQRLLSEHGLRAEQVPASGPGGRLLKEDVVAFVGAGGAAAAPSAPAPAGGGLVAAASGASLVTAGSQRGEEVKPMSMIRRTIAARLVEAQQTAALLTTFNEVDMGPVMELRKKYKDVFVEKHGVKLGFMSFFAKAVVEALRRFPAVNAEIRGNHVVYRHYYDIGIAIGGGKGLVVPVVRNVEQMSFADIERAIADYGRAAAENRINPQDLEGGTFTISNGGVYGSLLSTPIVNPPQSGILGLHAIQDRPMAVNGQVVIRPMMYLALTYDHRIVDGREAVSFLRTIKETIEDPARLFLEV